MHSNKMLSVNEIGRFEQLENAARTYTVDWNIQLGTDTISSSTWTAENSGSTIANEATGTTTTSARLSGTPGKYLFTNKIVTSGGDTLECQLILIVKNNDRSMINDYISETYI